MCGLVGIVSKSDVNLQLYDALTMLQHRGQDAAGIVTCDNGRIAQQKGNGLVKDVFHTRHMRRLAGNYGIGHVRYPTAGSSGPALAQPFYVNSPYGIALAHNGNLTNADAVRDELYRDDLRHMNTDSDSEVLLNVFAKELQKLGKLRALKDDIFTAVTNVNKRVKGGYAAVALIANYGLVAFRDPDGIRPLVFGQRDTLQGPEFMIASESVALDVLGFNLVRDVKPGEAIFITTEGELHTQMCAENTTCRPCIFEHVYFARPDSIMDGISVYKARLRQGEKLAEKILRERPDHDIDVVIPIPDSSRVSGQALAYNLGVKFRVLPAITLQARVIESQLARHIPVARESAEAKEKKARMKKMELIFGFDVFAKVKMTGSIVDSRKFKLRLRQSRASRWRGSKRVKNEDNGIRAGYILFSRTRKHGSYYPLLRATY